MGKGSSSGSSTAVISPEQTKQNQLTNQLLESYIPVLNKTLSGATDTYNQVAPGVQAGSQNVVNDANALQLSANNAANNALGTSDQWSKFATGLGAGSSAGATNAADILTTGGTQAGSFGAQALGSIFSPEYEKAQVKAALTPAMEAAREASGGQTAMFGGSGGAGSSREALANQNLNSLNTQRLGTIAATTQGNIENQRLGAASTLFNTGIGAVNQGGNILGGLANTAVGVGNTANVTGALGNTLGNTGLNAATTGLTASTAPMSLFNQYASTVFGVPSNTTTANFTGAQGANTSSKGKGIKL